MRNINDFLGLEEISTLCQYLYLAEENSVIVNNGMTYLEIRMDEEYNFYVQNLSFPDSEEMNYTEMMTVSQMLGVVEYLKSRPPKENLQAKSRWDEIQTIVKLSTAINKVQKKGAE